MENRLAQLRKEEKMTLVQLGALLDIRDNTLSQYETGKRNPQLGIWEEIAIFFEVSLAYLLCKTDVRDHKFTNDDEAIELIKKIDRREIHTDELTHLTLAELGKWIARHIELFVDKKSPNYLDLEDGIHIISTAADVKLQSVIDFIQDRHSAEHERFKNVQELLQDSKMQLEQSENKKPTFDRKKQRILSFIDETYMDNDIYNNSLDLLSNVVDFIRINQEPSSEENNYNKNIRQLSYMIDILNNYYSDVDPAYYDPETVQSNLINHLISLINED
ncbi:helix-turn-helix domain-containing protein (plasmid) [Holzapfeliella sp. JNUCC 72]